MPTLVRSAVLLVLFAFASSPALAGEGWLTDYKQAVALSKKTKRPILADFTGSDWCFWCKKLKKEVFATPEFKAWAKERVVLLELDYPSDRSTQSAELQKQNKTLQDRYAIEGYPTIVILQADGKELGRLGYQKGGPAKWIASADAILAKASTRAAANARWSEDYEAALEQARATGKVVLADFTGSDWCGWCVTLKKEVFETPEFKAWAKDSAVLLELDYPQDKPQSDALKAQNKALLKKYGISGYPTVLLLNGKGEELGRLGYMRGGPTVWIAKAKALLAGASK